MSYIVLIWVLHNYHKNNIKMQTLLKVQKIAITVFVQKNNFILLCLLLLFTTGFLYPHNAVSSGHLVPIEIKTCPHMHCEGIPALIKEADSS